MILAFDTETTGLDLHHLAKPFMVTACFEDGREMFWRWDIDPITRRVIVPADDIVEVSALLIDGGNDEHFLVGQNVKFDVAALRSVGVDVSDWPWDRTFDTLVAGHVLHSGQPHDLTSMAGHWLGKKVKEDMIDKEKALEEACKQARAVARVKCKGESVLYVDRVVVKTKPWLIAKEGMPGLPSVKGGGSGDKGKVWKNDLWLPRAIAVEQGFTSGHSWWTVCEDYARMDAQVTVLLWKAQSKELHEKRLM
jgi:hypothetical protein